MHESHGDEAVFKINIAIGAVRNKDSKKGAYVFNPTATQFDIHKIDNFDLDIC